jgi:hypothetical protein
MSRIKRTANSACHSRWINTPPDRDDATEKRSNSRIHQSSISRRKSSPISSPSPDPPDLHPTLISSQPNQTYGLIDLGLESEPPCWEVDVLLVLLFGDEGLLLGGESTSDSSGLFVSEVEGEVCVFERVEGNSSER